MKAHHNRHNDTGDPIEEAKTDEVVPFKLGDWINSNFPETAPDTLGIAIVCLKLRIFVDFVEKGVNAFV